MASTEHSAVSLSPSPTSPSPALSDCNLILRIVPYDGAAVRGPPDFALDGYAERFGDNAAANSDPSDDEFDLPLLLHAARAPCDRHVKAKRLSSTSNDQLYERDRFRARYLSLNPSDDVEQQDCEVCGRILSKTKKLNVTSAAASPGSSSTLLAQTSLESTPPLHFPLEESLSPLHGALAFFRNLAQLGSSRLLAARVLSVAQLAAVFHWYFNRPLPPTAHMFPWLHGIHQDNFAQRSFFISQQLSQSARYPGSHYVDFFSDVAKPDDARFLMCVSSAKLPAITAAGHVLRNTVDLNEVLKRIEYSRAEVKLQVGALLDDCFPDEDPDALAELADLVARDCFETGHMPVFLNLDPERGVSLRNFHIQVAKLARCSDFVVFCAENSHLAGCKCEALSRLLQLAQISERDSLSNRYSVFVLNTTGYNIEEDYSGILTVGDNSLLFMGLEATKKTNLLMSSMRLLTSDTFSAWDADFQVKEKVETTKMSAATRLLLNVWLGNIWDHLVMLQNLKHEHDSLKDLLHSTFEITPLNSTGLYCNPEHSALLVSSDRSPGANLLSILPPPRAHWQLFVHCHNDAAFPSEALLSDLLFKYTISSRLAAEVDSIHSLEFPSSGSIGFGDCKPENLTSIINTCKLLYLYSSSVNPNSLASLIYCSDGYTELSLLILSFLIYAENVTLDDAILKLHLEYGRPFYIFNSDVIILRKLESLLRKYSPKVLGSSIEWPKLETTTKHEINEALLARKQPAQAGCKEKIPNKLRLGYIANDSDSESSEESEDDEEDLNDTSSYLNSKWVEDVEGSLPSRILPYLYLGSLKHANSLTVLSKLGIKKVISVGEKLDWLSGYKFQHNNDIIVDELDAGSIEVFSINPKPFSFVKNSAKCTVDSVMKVNNLQDDGIDELTRSLPQILAYIDDEYRRTNGDTKILVHCRVGVSRSATVVIAEVMRRLGLNLPRAYLYVRVRRLNIVIQPNLRFMYELFKWEEVERARRRTLGTSHEPLREIDWFVMCQEIKKLNLPFFNNS